MVFDFRALKKGPEPSGMRDVGCVASWKSMWVGYMEETGLDKEA